ncbi:MAG: hypothetical protein J2P37_06220 [Ktedonobacteraceae bacterium]|nr:hypothetical protein [Ktedonobacteraceae bacterium]
MSDRTQYGEGDSHDRFHEPDGPDIRQADTSAPNSIETRVVHPPSQQEIQAKKDQVAEAQVAVQEAKANLEKKEQQAQQASSLAEGNLTSIDDRMLHAFLEGKATPVDAFTSSLGVHEARAHLQGMYAVLHNTDAEYHDMLALRYQHLGNRLEVARQRVTAAELREQAGEAHISVVKELRECIKIKQKAAGESLAAAEQQYEPSKAALAQAELDYLEQVLANNREQLSSASQRQLVRKADTLEARATLEKIAASQALATGDTHAHLIANAESTRLNAESLQKRFTAFEVLDYDSDDHLQKKQEADLSAARAWVEAHRAQKALYEYERQILEDTLFKTTDTADTRACRVKIADLQAQEAKTHYDECFAIMRRARIESQAFLLKNQEQEPLEIETALEQMLERGRLELRKEKAEQDEHIAKDSLIQRRQGCFEIRAQVCDEAAQAMADQRQRAEWEAWAVEYRARGAGILLEFAQPEERDMLRSQKQGYEELAVDTWNKIDILRENLPSEPFPL